MIWEDSHDIGGDLTAYRDVCSIGLDLKVTIAGKLGVTTYINTTAGTITLNHCINTITEDIKKTLGITR